MKMLMLAQPNSSWTINIIQYYLIPRGVEVYLYPFWTVDEYFQKVYEENHVVVLDRIEKGKENRRFSWIMLLRKYIREYGIDIINIQYVQYEHLLPVFLFKRKNQKLILSYWGSDLLRKDDRYLRKLYPLFTKVDSFTHESKNLMECFERLYGKKYEDKVHFCPFGIPILSEIKKSESVLTKEKLRSKYGIEEGKVVIAIGYNARLQQQHLKVIEQIETLSIEDRDKICIMLQVNYNIDSEEYVKEVIAEAKKSQCQVVAIHDFMNFAQMAEIRRITDVFVNSQTTDAFAGSVCEVMYAGGTLVHGEWLNYKEFEELDVDYVPYHEFDELPEIFSRIIRKEYSIDYEKNREVMAKLRSWDYCGLDWDRWLLGINDE